MPVSPAPVLLCLLGGTGIGRGGGVGLCAFVFGGLGIGGMLGGGTRFPGLRFGAPFLGKLSLVLRLLASFLLARSTSNETMTK